MKMLTVQRIAKNLAKFTPPIILEQSKTTRRCFYGELASDDAGNWDLRGNIVCERKGKNGWHPLDGAALNKLKGGEITKLELRRDHVRNFIRGLQVLAEAAQTVGIDLRGDELVVGKKDEMLHVPSDQRAMLEQLINENGGTEFWEMLQMQQPELTARLADAEILRQREVSVSTFEVELSAQRWDEPAWEAFFRENQWIFGLGLRFQFLSVLQNQANYGGGDYSRRGEQKGEFLMTSEADERFTVLVEIKRPDTKFFRDAPYRSGVPGFNTEFVNAVSQVQVNTHTWETEGSRRERDAVRLARANIRTISPRSILVCGHLRELADDIDKRNAFELFRCRLSAPDIVTFDELLARARFIVTDHLRDGDEADRGHSVMS
jgi:Domain of unknown function (DUF4263)